MPRTKDAARFFFSSSEWETMTSLCEPHHVKITQFFLCKSFHYCKTSLISRPRRFGTRWRCTQTRPHIWWKSGFIHLFFFKLGTFKSVQEKQQPKKDHDSRGDNKPRLEDKDDAGGAQPSILSHTHICTFPQPYSLFRRLFFPPFSSRFSHQFQTASISSVAMCHLAVCFLR